MSLTETHATHAREGDETATVLRILLSVAVFVAGWATSVALWGIPGLYIPALALVPVAWVLLLMISRG
ncbi:MAG: hypothetical protein COW54_06885 [Rhodobacteraceae bacterium CG17_big_fil_post_rev_8_21_14_2_50_63_15]|nr:hypothetical protein [Roseovarius sp.]PIV78902.1 MAG: hypothetical protein COW54_06885 [Rhodobacteraceae bacterium CG17_big_fil_post_rev_8_21_14_2_50_63_15]